jgi:hypothetical protein
MVKRLAVVVLLAGCAGSTPAPQGASPAPVVLDASAAPDADRRVCCESFGYGARMVECCTKAVWTKADECQVPPGFVGGGKRVVDDAKCQ